MIVRRYMVTRLAAFSLSVSTCEGGRIFAQIVGQKIIYKNPSVLLLLY